MIKENNNCGYDDSTKVLTNSGWKLFKDLTLYDSILSVNIKDGTCFFEKPKYITQCKCQGKAIKVEAQHLDLMVGFNTPLVVSLYDKDNIKTFGKTFDFVKAKEVEGTKVKFLKSSNILNKEDLLNGSGKLIGFFLGDGSYKDDDAIQFTLQTPRKSKYFKTIIADFQESSFSVFIVRQEGIGKWFKENCYNKQQDKKLPDNYLYYSQKDVQDILEGLRESDGTDKNSTWAYYTTSKQLVEQLTTLSALHGFVFTVTDKKYSNKKYATLYSLNFSNRISPEVSNSAARSNSKTAIEAYSGDLYCLYNSTGAIMVKRNNHICVSGCMKQLKYDT